MILFWEVAIRVCYMTPRDSSPQTLIKDLGDASYVLGFEIYRDRSR
jgi:hypothetical protein